jgi:WD40 repeat protein
LLAIILTSCSGANLPAPTETPLPEPTPALVIAAPALVKEIKLDTESGTAYTLDWSHKGEILAAGSGGEITLMSNDLSETIAILKPDSGALGISWSPDGNQIATVNGYRNPTITIWNWDGSNQLIQDRQIDGGSDQYGVSWSPDGNLLATLGDDEKSIIQLWDTSTWEQVNQYELPYENPRRALNWSADSRTFMMLANPMDRLWHLH